MKKFFRKIKISGNYFLLGLFILAIVFILFPQILNAASSDVTVGGVVVSAVKTLAASPILLALGVISVLVIGVIGALNMMIISFLVNIVQYNNFINEPSIVSAWVVVRDLCNMFFILILLVIAFATILRLPNYEWKKLLPKLLIMAVLINFSRTITGLIIDASQVIMLTFTSAFGTGGNFVDMTQMAKYFTGVTFGDFGTDNFSVLNVVIGMLVGIMFLIISGIVLVVAMSVFLMRIVMLWILLVLSPLAFLAAAFPAGQKYATQWWSEFVKYILNGPVLAFFIWMALITSQQKVAFFTQGDAAASLAKQCFGGSQIMCMGTFMPFVLSIGMLIGGLMITQQIGGIGAGMASKGLGWAKGAGMLLGKGGLMYGGWLGRKVKSGAVSEIFGKKEVDAEGNIIGWQGRGKTGKVGAGIASALYGLELRPTKMIQGIREGLKATAEKEEAQATGASAISLKRGGFGGLVKGLGVSRDLTEALVGPGGILWHKGFRRVYESTIGGGPKGMEKLEKEIAAKKASGASPEEIDKLEKKLSLRKPIQTFYADRAREELISKASKMLGDNDNEEFLQETLRDAIASGNKEVAQAVILHAAKVSHLNEMMHGYKSKRDVYEWNEDENGNKVQGKLLARKGQALPQGGAGLNELIKQALIEDLGIDEQTAYATQSEASTLAKSVKHMNMAESVGSKNGFLYQRATNGKNGQLARAKGEARKVDAESFIRNYNRIGWGDEFVNANGDREFKLNALGLDTFTELADIINKEIGGRRLNKNAAMNIASDKDTLLAWAKKLDDGGIKYYDGNDKGEKGDFMHSYVKLAERLIEYGNSVAQAQKGRSTSGEGIKEMQAEVLKNQKRP